MIAQRYTPDMAPLWNAFVAGSRNGTFLLDRGYMDYHHDRFTDHSLLFRDERGDLVAILPANQNDDRLASHGGLTYGGLVLAPAAGAVQALAVFDTLRQYMRSNGLVSLLYKCIPWIYHVQPAEDDRYALFRHGARLVRRDVLSVVSGQPRLGFQSRRARGAKSARKLGVAVGESEAFEDFWPILSDNLKARFGVPPVHSLAEIALLHGRFPQQIRLFVARLEGEAIAGVVVYETRTVAHVQYIAASAAGRDAHALDAIFDHLLNEVYAGKPYFDFGISNEEQGRVLNQGLVEQKEGFGARSVAHDYYELDA